MKKLLIIISAAVLAVASAALYLFWEEYRIPEANNIEYEDIDTEGGDILLNVPYYSQEDYPTGCELVSASMLLEYYGFVTNPGELIDEGHIQTNVISEINGVRYGGDPDKVFIGSPYDENSYGCYSGAVKSCLESYLSGEPYKIADLSGTSLAGLCEEYIKKDIPVLVWASIGMTKTYTVKSSSWIIEETGELFQWISGEYCLVLVGFDDENYFFNDPYNGNGVTSFEKELAEARYAELGMQALAVIPYQ